MKQNIIVQAPLSFRLPRYQEIPNVGLYLEQVNQYIGEYMGPLSGDSLTTSMISNYVKKKLVSAPQKKRYNRDQIATLFFIATAKMVMSMNDIAFLLKKQKENYDTAEAYNYFCEELEQSLSDIFHGASIQILEDESASLEKVILRNICIAVSHSIYIAHCLRVSREQEVDNEKAIGE